MSRYKLWDKKEDIYTLGADSTGKMHWTAEEYIAQKAAWAGIPTVKVIVGGGVINGTMFMEFEATKEFYVSQGCDFSTCTTDEEILAAMEAWDDRAPEVSDEPTPAERQAAALEYIAMCSIPDDETV